MHVGCTLKKPGYKILTMNTLIQKKSGSLHGDETIITIVVL